MNIRELSSRYGLLSDSLFIENGEWIYESYKSNLKKRYIGLDQKGKNRLYQIKSGDVFALMKIFTSLDTSSGREVLPGEIQTLLKENLGGIERNHLLISDLQEKFEEYLKMVVVPAMQEEYGYTPERLTEGKTLLESAKGTKASHVAEYSDKYVATNEVGKRFTSAYGQYMITLKVTRVALKKQPELLTRFKATGKRRRSLTGWLSDATIFYSNLLESEEAIVALSKFGITPERLRKEQELVKEIEDLHSQQLVEKGEALQATKDRDKLIDEIGDWYSDFRAIARVALFDKPKLLEALGIVTKERKSIKKEKEE
jgi:hypothetical protein